MPISVPPAPRRRVVSSPIVNPPIEAPTPKLPVVAVKATTGKVKRSVPEVNRLGVNVVAFTRDGKRGKGKITKPRGRSFGVGKPPSIGVIRLGNRDLWWLELTCRFKHLTYEELVVWSQVTRGAVSTRFPKLVKSGVFDAWRFGTVTTLTPTRKAALRYGLSWLLPTKSILEPAWTVVHHSSAVARVAMAYELADPLAQRHVVVSEREIRAGLKNPEWVDIVARDTASWVAPGDTPLKFNPEMWVAPEMDGFSRIDGMISGGYHLPDLVLLRRGELPVAVEVELTAKKMSEYVRLFDSYGGMGGRERFAGVQYFCGSERIVDQVQAGVVAAGVEGFVHVAGFPDNMPLPVERPNRSTGRVIPKGAWTS
jgi:hypothetical protein